MKEQLQKEIERVEKIIHKFPYKETHDYILSLIEQSKDAMANNDIDKISRLYREIVIIKR